MPTVLAPESRLIARGSISRIIVRPDLATVPVIEIPPLRVSTYVFRSIPQQTLYLQGSKHYVVSSRARNHITIDLQRTQGVWFDSITILATHTSLRQNNGISRCATSRCHLGKRYPIFSPAIAKLGYRFMATARVEPCALGHRAGSRITMSPVRSSVSACPVAQWQRPQWDVPA
jgi:hypothetical protein